MSKLDETHTRLKTARLAAGYRTAINFCEKNQIPVSTYNMHETGKRKLSADVAEKYACGMVVHGRRQSLPGTDKRIQCTPHRR